MYKSCKNYNTNIMSYTQGRVEHSETSKTQTHFRALTFDWNSNVSRFFNYSFLISI